MDQRYYWIKLNTNFFSDNEAIDYLMSQRNGSQYVTLYLMLCLMSANRNGELTYTVGEVLVPYDVDKIVRDCKYFSRDTVILALELFRKLNLLYIAENGVYRLAMVEKMIGSESKSTERVRQYRERKALQCNTNVTESNVTETLQNVTQPLHCSLRDKRLDIRESKSNKSIEEEVVKYSAHARETTASTAICLPVSAAYVVELDSYFLAQLKEMYPKIDTKKELAEIELKLVASNYPCKDQTALQKYVLAWFRNKATDLAEQSSGIMNDTYDASALNEKIRNINYDDV